VLRPIAGKPMLQWVLEGANHADLLSDLIVATDSSEVFEFCRALGYHAQMTSPDHASGTDRINEVASRTEADVFVNIQGDEPLVRREHIEALLAPFDDGACVSTLATPLPPEEAGDPNRVKVVMTAGGRAIYFSRAAVPYDREGSPGGPLLKHLGFYAYSRYTLERFHRLAPSPLERREKLEQLRLIENDVPIQVVITPFDTIGVDTEADLLLAERLLLARTLARPR
jgi:3-deoxy-manno-octulosonate cytidylyltransferase (CMP-KDO synthetase)